MKILNLVEAQYTKVYEFLLKSIPRVPKKESRALGSLLREMLVPEHATTHSDNKKLRHFSSSASISSALPAPNSKETVNHHPFERHGTRSKA